MVRCSNAGESLLLLQGEPVAALIKLSLAVDKGKRSKDIEGLLLRARCHEMLEDPLSALKDLNSALAVARKALAQGGAGAAEKLAAALCARADAKRSIGGARGGQLKSTCLKRLQGSGGGGGGGKKAAKAAARVLKAAGRDDGGLSDLDEAVGLHGAAVAPRLARAPALVAAGDVGRALADYSKVIEMLPAHVEARMRRGALLSQVKKRSIAHNDLSCAVVPMPVVPLLWLLLLLLRPVLLAAVLPATFLTSSSRRVCGFLK